MSQVITEFCMERDRSKKRSEKEQTLSTIHARMKSSGVCAKAYFPLIDDVYSMVFQDPVHFCLSSDFQKLLNEDFVNITKVETYSYDNLVILPNSFSLPLNQILLFNQHDHSRKSGNTFIILKTQFLLF